MGFGNVSLKLIFIITGLILLLSPANAAVVSVYANFEHLKIPFTQWYHGGNAQIVEENGNKVLEVSGGSAGRVLGVDVQYAPYIQLQLDLKLLNSSNGYLRIVAFGYPMSSEEYKADREICGIYVNKEAIFSFNGFLKKLVTIEKGWNTLTLNLNLQDGIASLEYGGEKYIFNVPQTEGKYFIFRVDPGTEARLDEINLKAGEDFNEFFNSYTFSKATPPPIEGPTPSGTAVQTQSPSPAPLPTPDFDKLKIILDKNYELLYKTEYNSHNFYIVKYYNYLPPGTGVEVVTERGFKIGIEEKDLVKNILDTLDTSDVEKELLYRSWEDRQNGIITVYVSVIAFLLFLLGLLAVIVWKA
ncbi:MAG: hypothetical protein H0Z28_00065 [Archaeoglobus sp.]|nr:hypothetical protein [Archaeoglobus sp.]